MDIIDVLEFIGGISLFLFGMNYMGTALEKKAGGKMSSILSRFTSNKITGFLLGLIVTTVIQSSSATTVMVIGFVNSGLMTLTQSVGVIIGANVGTTVTAWILSLTGIQGDSIVLTLLKPSSFAPVFALIGIIFYVFLKDNSKRDTGMIFVGFSVLMFGMNIASGAVSHLSEVPGFARLFILFKNPVLGVLAGAVLTAVIQSSSASVGVLQALCTTGQVSVAAALPIILGQNIGTCITAMLSCMGANRNAKRAAVIHLNFNVLGSILIMILFYSLNAVFHFSVMEKAATTFSVAVIHTLCNLFSAAVFLPLSGLLEKLSYAMVKDMQEEKEEKIILDERFFVNPASAVMQCRNAVCKMAKRAQSAFKAATELLNEYSEEKREKIYSAEKRLDEYEDAVSSYLVKLSTLDLSENDSKQVATLLYVTGAFERLSDHAVHIEKYVQGLTQKNSSFTKDAKKQLQIMCGAVNEAISLTVQAFIKNDITLSKKVQPLEQVIDRLSRKLKESHVARTLSGECSFDAGLIYSDIISVLERTADHCSDIAASIIEIPNGALDVHAYAKQYQNEETGEFSALYNSYKNKYSLENTAK